MRIMVIPFVILLFLSCMLRAQTGTVRPIRSGDTVPDIKLTIHIADTTKAVRLRDFRGKHILIDFWGVRCSSCISGMEQMLELQNKFPGKIQVLIVTEDDESDIEQLWARLAKRPATKKWINIAKQLSFVKRDTILSVLFPHEVLPTHVWIDANRVLRGVAYSSSTTQENIEAFLAGKNLRLDEQQLRDIDIDDPFSWLGDAVGLKNQMQAYSILTRRLESGRGSRSKIYYGDNDDKAIGVSCLNLTVLDLYKLAYKNWMPSKAEIPDNRIIIEAKDQYKLVWPRDQTGGNWDLDSNTFCYALRIASTTKNDMYHLFKSDIDRFFKLESTVQPRQVTCLILKRISDDDRIRSQSLTSKFIKGNKLVIQKLDVGYLYHNLQNLMNIQSPENPFLDETNYKGQIDIELPWNNEYNIFTIPVLRRALQRYGLDLIEEVRNMDMLIIKDQTDKS